MSKGQTLRHCLHCGKPIWAKAIGHRKFKRCLLCRRCAVVAHGRYGSKKTTAKLSRQVFHRACALCGEGECPVRVAFVNCVEVVFISELEVVDSVCP